VIRLSRVGFDNTLGYLKGGVDAWEEAGKEVDTVNSISAAELESSFGDVKDKIFDVRKVSEFESEHIEEASNTPLGSLNHIDL